MSSTWEEKIDSLVKIAKAAGRYVNSRDEQGTDYNNEALFNLREAYDEFCEWRHDEPYVVDEIKVLLGMHPHQQLTPKEPLSEPKVIIEDNGVRIISQLSSTITHDQFISEEALSKILVRFLFREDTRESI